MKIGILSDIHGNDVALKAVLADAHTIGVDELFILGDMIGYYYWPQMVLILLQSWVAEERIQGNHERLLQKVCQTPTALAAITTEYGHGLHVAYNELTTKQHAMLLSYPARKEVIRDGCYFLLCHGSPLDPDQYIYPDARFDLLQQCALPDYDFILIGHTHRPFCYHQQDTLLLNPGSVGQPRDIGNLASYAIVDTTNRTTQLRRVPFATAKIMAECARRDPNHPYLVNILKRGVE